MGTLRAILSLAIGEIRNAITQPQLVAWLVILPIIFSSLLALFETGTLAPSRVLWSGPSTGVALSLRQELERYASVETAGPRADNQLGRTDRDAWIKLPKDFNERVAANQNVTVPMYLALNSSRAFEASMLVIATGLRFEAPQAAKDVLLQMRPSASVALQNEVYARTKTAVATSKITLERRVARSERTHFDHRPQGAAQTTPGMTLMFALLFGAQTGLSLQRDRQNGVLARLYSSPLKSWQIIVGKLLGMVFLMMAQLAMMILFSSTVLGVRWGNVAALVLPALAFATVSGAFGAFCATVTRTPAQLSSTSILIVNLVSALGGLWWPIEVTPDWMQRIAQFLPTYWGLNAFQGVMLRGATVLDVWPHSLILVGFAVILLFFGARAYRMD